MRLDIPWISRSTKLLFGLGCRQSWWEFAIWTQSGSFSTQLMKLPKLVWNTELAWKLAKLRHKISKETVLGNNKLAWICFLHEKPNAFVSAWSKMLHARHLVLHLWTTVHERCTICIWGLGVGEDQDEFAKAVSGSKCLISPLSDANGHITLNTPVLVRSLKLSSVEPSQYLDGWPPGNTGCCWHHIFLALPTNSVSQE